MAAALPLADIRAVLDTEARLDDIRSAYHADASTGSRRQLTTQAIEATERMLTRIDERLTRLRGFRRQLADKLARMQAHVAELGREESHPRSGPTAAADDVAP